jgi:micrococcal nuclease
MVKRILSSLVILSIVISGLSVSAATTTQVVKLEKCTDGDTARFVGVGATRFLYVDTPESTNKIEPFGKEASAFTCSLLTKAKVIKLEYDGPQKDKYGRTLAWVWADGKLVQQSLIERGFVKGFYDYGTYKYEALMIKLQASAKAKKVGMWTTVAPKPTATPSPTPKPEQTASPSPTSAPSQTPIATPVATQSPTPTPVNTENFANCTELRKVYPNGVPKGHPAYQAKMDRDKDDYACEQ